MCRHAVVTRAHAKQLELPDRSVKLFAYGANLSPAVLQKRGVWPLQRAVRAVAPADAVLIFCHRGGFATIDLHGQTASVRSDVSHAAKRAGAKAGQQQAADMPAADAAAALCSIVQPHGMLYSLTASTMAMLAKHETGYRLAAMWVTPYGVAHPVAAQVFVSQRMLRLQNPLPPTKRYHDLILSGAKSWQLSDDYIRQLAMVPTAVTGGLPDEYFDTPSAGVATAVIICAALAAAGIWLLL